MKREIVLSTSGGRVLTGSGLRPVAGNSEFGVGAKVFMLDNAILGQKRTQARRKPFEEIIITPRPPIPVVGYKFASGTTMYYTDLELNLLRVESITPPAENAQLLAHTYNERVEYLIWFVDSRCIIQKDGETIADFASAFPWEPEEIDAYVDGAGDIVWVAAAGWADGDCIIARYKNGTLQQSVDIGAAAASLFASVKADAATALAGVLASVSGTKTLTSRVKHYDATIVRWAAGVVVPFDVLVSSAGSSYFCVVAGTTGETEPTWGTDTVIDGTVEWQKRAGSIDCWTKETTVAELTHYFSEDGGDSGGYINHLGFLLWDLSAVVTMRGGAYPARHGAIAREVIRDYTSGTVLSDETFPLSGSYQIGWLYKTYGAKINTEAQSCLQGWLAGTDSGDFEIGPIEQVEVSTSFVDGAYYDRVQGFFEYYTVHVSTSLPGESLSTERLESTRTIGDFALKQIADLDGTGWQDYKRWDEVGSLTTDYDLLIGRAWSAKVGLIYGWPTADTTNIITASGVTTNTLPAVATKRFTGVTI